MVGELDMGRGYFDVLLPGISDFCVTFQRKMADVAFYIRFFFQSSGKKYHVGAEKRPLLWM